MTLIGMHGENGMNRKTKRGREDLEERKRIRVRMYDRADARITELSSNEFEKRYKVRVVLLEDNKWYAECPAHDYHSLGYTNRRIAEGLAELHVKYYHTVVVM